jgi:hypothetical protein
VSSFALTNASLVQFFLGGIMILTCLAALMKLLDDTGVTSFEMDTTFRRIVGDINEWEVVLFLKALQRGESTHLRISQRH